MVKLKGRGEMERQAQRVETLFETISNADLAAELNAHYARYLAIRLSGFAEISLKSLIMTYVDHRTDDTVYKHVDARIQRIWGISKEKLRQALDGFNPQWWSELEHTCSVELESLQSIGNLRDNISHGGDSGITLSRVRAYKIDIIRLFRVLADVLDPND